MVGGSPPSTPAAGCSVPAPACAAQGCLPGRPPHPFFRAYLCERDDLPVATVRQACRPRELPSAALQAAGGGEKLPTVKEQDVRGLRRCRLFRLLLRACVWCVSRRGKGGGVGGSGSCAAPAARAPPAAQNALPLVASWRVAAGRRPGAAHARNSSLGREQRWAGGLWPGGCARRDGGWGAGGGAGLAWRTAAGGSLLAAGLCRYGSPGGGSERWNFSRQRRH